MNKKEKDMVVSWVMSHSTHYSGRYLISVKQLRHYLNSIPEDTTPPKKYDPHEVAQMKEEFGIVNNEDDECP